MMPFSRSDSRVTICSNWRCSSLRSGIAGKHADRSGDGGQRIADFVRDGGGQAAHRRQAVLHPHFPLQAPDFGQIVEV